MTGAAPPALDIRGDAGPAPRSDVGAGNRPMTTGAPGTTLIEILIGLVLGLTIVAGLTGVLVATLAAHDRAGSGSERVVAGAAALDQLARDVRLAGYDPQGRGVVGVRSPTASSVVLDADLDGDGTIDAHSEEHITYRVASSSGSLLRVVGAQSLPLLVDLAAGGFTLHYLDGGGAELDPTAPATADAARMISADIVLAATRTLPAVQLHGGARLLNR